MKSFKSHLEEARGSKPPQISKGIAKGSITAKGIRGKGMKKFDVDVKVDNGKFSFRITDESGKFQTVNIKQAAKMLGEEYVDSLVQEIEEELSAKQKKIDLNKNGKVDGQDFAMLRAKKKK